MKLTDKTHGTIAEGIVANTTGLTTNATIAVRFTSDKTGETLSLEALGIIFIVPYEPVKELIEETRKSSGKQYRT